MDPDALLRLTLVVTSLAALPTGVWLMRARGLPPARRLGLLTALTVFLTFDLVVFGAFTRLTDSGLGCPDWPGCYGEASPWAAREAIHAEQAVRPQGPVTWTKAWIEMVHRYLAMTVGLLIVAGALAAWRHRHSLPHSAGWATLTLAWVIVQGLFGRYTVTLKLYPAIVTLHLLGGVVLLALLVFQQASFDRVVRPPLRLGTRRAAIGALVILMIQVALGGWVSTNYAVVACQGFPQCNGQWWPDMDWAQGFTLLRDLGQTDDGSWLTLPALVAIHWTHRLFALVVLVAAAFLAWRLLRTPGWQPNGRALAGLLALQWATGVINVVWQWPLWAALLHTAGAAALAGLMVHVVAVDHLSRRARAPDGVHLTSAAGA